MQVPYLIREIVSYTVIGVIPIALTFPVIFYFGMMWGYVALFIGVLISVGLGLVICKHEFTPLLRGKGILAIDINSTGILRPFIVNVFPPFIKSQIGDNVVKDVFDRKAVFNFVVPKKTNLNISKMIKFWEKKKDEENISGVSFDKESGDCYLKLTADEYQESRFGYKQYPCLLWNSQVNSFLTKEFLSGQEKEAFAEHTILYQNKLLEELIRMIWHLCRSSIDLLNPNKGKLMKSIFWIILIIGLLVIGIFFVPKIFEFFTSGMGGAVGGATGQAVTPR